MDWVSVSVQVSGTCSGTWELILTELPDDPCGCCGASWTLGYSKVFIEDSRMTLSGGMMIRLDLEIRFSKNICI